MDFTFLKKFDLRKDKESKLSIRTTIEKDTVFEGFNLWILFFAILIASLGLNTNSTAVIIGAMLISPLMGPILGIGFAVSTNDLKLLRLGIRNYVFALFVGLTASTIYFLLSPVEDAHSEILARTQPTIFDVLIALFGGFAGFIAISSKTKGNVIPGVAIATALMPPLCTAGYGLATWQLNYFFGALYMFWINSVFIALATIISSNLLKFPSRKYENKGLERKEKAILYAIVVLTLIPSIYFGFKIVQNQKFAANVNTFINNEGFFQDDYLVKKELNEKERTVHLSYVGKIITKQEIETLRSKLKHYNLANVKLFIHQGFSLSDQERLNSMDLKLKNALAIQDNQNRMLSNKLDSLDEVKVFEEDIARELRALYPDFETVFVQQSTGNKDSSNESNPFLVFIETAKKPLEKELARIQNWLVVRLKTEHVKLVFSQE